MSIPTTSSVPRKFTPDDYVRLGEEVGWSKTNSEMHDLLKSRGLSVEFIDVYLASVTWGKKKVSPLSSAPSVSSSPSSTDKIVKEPRTAGHGTFDAAGENPYTTDSNVPLISDEFTFEVYDALVKEKGDQPSGVMRDILKSRGYKVDLADVVIADYKWRDLHKGSDPASTEKTSQKFVDVISRLKKTSMCQERDTKKQIEDLLAKAKKGEVSISQETIRAVETFLEYELASKSHSALMYSGYTGGDSRTAEDEHYASIDSYAQRERKLYDQVLRAFGNKCPLVYDDVLKYLLERIDY